MHPIRHHTSFLGIPKVITELYPPHFILPLRSAFSRSRSYHCSSESKKVGDGQYVLLITTMLFLNMQVDGRNKEPQLTVWSEQPSGVWYAYAPVLINNACPWHTSQAARFWRSISGVLHVRASPWKTKVPKSFLVVLNHVDSFRCVKSSGFSTCM